VALKLQRVLLSSDRDWHHPHDFAFGHFQLCDDRDFVEACHTRGTSPGELPGPKTSQNGELEGAQFNRSVYHANRPFRMRDANSRPANHQ
jgi:hypothetical protein